MHEDKPTTKYAPPFSLRLSFEERAKLEQAAKGKPIGAYIKWIIFKDDLPSMPRRSSQGAPADVDQKSIAKLLGALGQSRIANNINQLAKAANSGSLPVNHDVLNSLNEAVNAVFWMRETLIKALGIKPIHEEEKDDLER
tara:strand:- start:59 stop:478 length:420 start_codon:yes stop_codon:yes gene_type:complete